jgi:hypothetical protein
MSSRTRVVAVCFLAIAQAGLLGCAIVDQYSGRAVGYNVEAEQAQEQALLLNIIRASLRKPMQYTSVQTITGSATSSGTATLNFPVGLHPTTGFTTGVLGGTVSGGPTFTVPVLDTQEFYQGIMKPIPGVLIDFYVHEEYPREEIFNLFIEKIVFRRRDCPTTSHLQDCEMTFVNYPGTDLDLDLTQAAIEYLLNLGLSTEQLPEDKTKPKNAKDSSSSSSSADSAKDAPPPPPSFRFCFSPRDVNEQASVPVSARCGFLAQPATSSLHPPGTAETSTPQANTPTPPSSSPTALSAPASPQAIGENARKTTTAPIQLSARFIRDLSNILEYETRENGQVDRYGYQLSLPHFENKLVRVDVYTRSTEGIVYYLGEIARRRLYPDPNFARGPRTVQIKIGNFYTRIPEGRCPLADNVAEKTGFHCYNFFVLDKGLDAGGAALAVNYGGTQYSVPSDLVEGGKTMHVLSLLKQLLAVNTSAKSLPQTNVISVISP